MRKTTTTTATERGTKNKVHTFGIGLPIEPILSDLTSDNYNKATTNKCVLKFRLKYNF